MDRHPPDAGAVMQITPTPLPGVMVVTATAAQDARGSFQRTWCAQAFAQAGLDFHPVQSSLSTNPRAGTLRGLHYQAPPHAEAKLVRCVAGRIWDVALDLRANSPTRLRWFGLELSSDMGTALFVPRGVAHGFVTLGDHAVVEYLIDMPYRPQAARGLRWNDPAFGINWPCLPRLMSDRDRLWADWQDD
jgi:dTDP-4-dehydrorhamnose 3,5-epimerase